MTVRQVETEMSAAELLEWKALYYIEAEEVEKAQKR